MIPHPSLETAPSPVLPSPILSETALNTPYKPCPAEPQVTSPPPSLAPHTAVTPSGLKHVLLAFRTHSPAFLLTALNLLCGFLLGFLEGQCRHAKGSVFGPMFRLQGPRGTSAPSHGFECRAVDSSMFVSPALSPPSRPGSQTGLPAQRSYARCCLSSVSSSVNGPVLRAWAQLRLRQPMSRGLAATFPYRTPFLMSHSQCTSKYVSSTQNTARTDHEFPPRYR